VVRALLVSLLLLLALTSCKGLAGPIAVTPGETALTSTPTPTLTSTPTLASTSTPTPAPYWDLLPLTSQPEGGWKTYQNDELDFTFQYPAVHDEGLCGRVWLEDKFWRDPPGTAVGLSSINMYVVETWSGELADQVSRVTSAPEVQLLTAVEPFSIDGLPALRFIFRIRGGPDTVDMPTTDYIKRAYVALAGTLYQFSYLHLADVYDCDAPPLSEEAVYEHLLTTVEFKH
jgi:hypothetical protein